MAKLIISADLIGNVWFPDTRPRRARWERAA
jgi:hypothetical protein